jgi:hypothetical protein
MYFVDDACTNVLSIFVQTINKILKKVSTKLYVYMYVQTVDKSIRTLLIFHIYFI